MTSRIRSLGLLTFACILISFVPVRGGNSELTSLLEKVILKRVVTQASFKGLTFESTAYKRNMNGDWEIKSEQIWQSVVSARDYETLYQRVLSVTEDGEPLDREKIEKEIDKLNENAEEDRDRRSFKEPLDTLYFADYEFAIDSTFSGIPNSMKIDFSSKVRDGKHLDGHIVVNRDDYGIVHKEFHLADNPTGVKDHRMKLDFEKQANGYYYASRLDFRGQFGVLFFNSRRELIEEYSNYSFGHSFPDSLFDKKASYEPGRDDGVNR